MRVVASEPVLDWSSPETWRWVWLVAAVAFALGELVTPAAFFFLPFAAGAFVASLLAFLGVGTGWEWMAFIGVSGSAFAVLWPIGRRLERSSGHSGVGANRWVGRQGVVLSDIPGEVGGTGLIRLEREQWRAESGMNGVPIRQGTTVLISRVHGTRLVVLPLDDGPIETHEPGAEPPQAGSEKGAQG
ncbi:MAG: NfeD family protein [Actinomycetota bacterium]|nr:NfeD family protein [Actinomycetota bacterium]